VIEGILRHKLLKNDTLTPLSRGMKSINGTVFLKTLIVSPFIFHFFIAFHMPMVLLCLHRELQQAARNEKLNLDRFAVLMTQYRVRH
jgi:hypothetical protein